MRLGKAVNTKSWIRTRIIVVGSNAKYGWSCYVASLVQFISFSQDVLILLLSRLIFYSRVSIYLVFSHEMIKEAFACSFDRLCRYNVVKKMTSSWSPFTPKCIYDHSSLEDYVI